jgi:hypothetical protein
VISGAVVRLAGVIAKKLADGAGKGGVVSSGMSPAECRVGGPSCACRRGYGRLT